MAEEARLRAELAAAPKKETLAVLHPTALMRYEQKLEYLATVLGARSRLVTRKAPKRCAIWSKQSR